MEFWERLEREVDGRSNRKAVLADAGVAINSISTWKKRRTYPGADVVVRIAAILGVTVEYLVTGTDSTDPWIRDNRRLIEELKLLSPEQRQAVDATVHTFAEIQRSKLGEGSASGGAS